MKNRSRNNQIAVPTSGDLLIADFQFALTNLATMDAAAAEAQYAENNIENALKYNNPDNGVFLTPGDISPEAADILTKSSVDAHLKKVQAQQIKNYTNSQVSQQQLQTLEKYKLPP